MKGEFLYIKWEQNYISKLHSMMTQILMSWFKESKERQKTLFERLQHRCFPVNNWIMQNFYEQFFYGAPLVAASEMYEYITYMLDLLKVSNNCLIFSLIEKHPNEPIIIYHNFSFLTEKSFWNLSSLLHNLTNVLNLFLFISTFFCLPQWLFFSDGLLTSLLSAYFHC